MSTERVNLESAFARVTEHWRPKVIAELNGQEVKISKLKGEFIWHHHEQEDEMFLVHKGRLRLEFRDRVVELGPGECLVVPRGVEHRPVAVDEVELILFEPSGVLNTGNVTDAKFTAPKGAKL
ncbi:MAG TPA: cupin domain-containing protein [Gemmatimonadales bacterium]